MNDDLRNRLRESCNRKAYEREARTPQPWKINERRIFLTLLRKEKKRSLLEIGAGTGRDGKFFQDNGLEVVCIDLSPEMVKLCQEKGLQAYLMDTAALQFPTGSFDAVYALNSLLHLSKAELPDVLKGIDRVLRSAGLFYLGIYGGLDYEGIWDKDSYEPKRFFSFFSEEHLRKVVEEVFDLESFQRIPLDGEDSGLHLQSVTLRKRKNSNAEV